MNKIKRPGLLSGLIITTIQLVIFIISQLIVKNDDIVTKIIFWFSIVILIMNICSFYTVNLTKAEFKKEKLYPWISVVLLSIYDLYYLAIMIINVVDGVYVNDVFIIANFIITTLGLLLIIFGILKRIIDNKITYSEHITKNSSKK